MKRVIILQIVLLAGIAAAATDPNLVGWWKLDDGTGTVAADSAGSKNGTVYGATWATGQVGGALSFDGANDSVELPINNPAWLPKNDFTVSTWAYFYGDPLSSLHDFLLDLDFSYWTDHARCSGYALFRAAGNGKAVFQIETTTTTDAVGSNVTLMKNRWYHIVGVRRGTTLEMYLDGQLNAANICSADPIKFSGDCINYRAIIGKMGNECGMPATYFLDGMVDDVRIYNRALSADEVQQLYTGEEVNEPTLAGLEIIGPDEVAEESTASYKAVAHYDNGASNDVTALAEWRVEPNIVAAIEAGQLTTGQVLYPRQNIKVYARYTEEQTTIDANLSVSVLAICPQGNALQFDGLNDYVELGSPANLDNLPLRDLTISAWIYDRHSAGNTWGTIFGTYMYPNGWTFRTISNTEGKRSLYLQVPVSGGSEISWATYQSGYGTILSNTWHHAAAVWNSGTKTARLYIDGAEPSYKVTRPGVGTYNSDASNNKEIGRLPFSGGMQYFNGTIDDVRIYNRALSAEEIGAIMYSKPTGSDPNLVAYWDFDEGAGQTVADISGRGNNGTLGSSAGIDTADPCWVDSDAPVGRCTTEQVMLRNLLGATDNKKIANQLIADAKAKERASIQLITILQNQMNRRERANASLAKTQINFAIIQEEMVSRQIDATIRRLENALRLLDYEVDPNGRPPAWRPPWNPWPGVNNGGNR